MSVIRLVARIGRVWRRSARFARGLGLFAALVGIATMPATAAEPDAEVGASREAPALPATPPTATRAASAATLPMVDAPPPAGPSVDERLAAIQALVEAKLVYPALARRQGISGEPQIEFSIDPHGVPRSITTRRSSGSLALDRAAVRAVRDAAPLPFVYGTLVIPVRFALDAR